MSQTGITKPLCLAILEDQNIKETIKKDLDKTILVKNLSKNLTARQFYLKMREYGDIKVCKLNTDYYGQSKGFGYVFYQDSKFAETALNDLQGKELDGKVLQVCHLIPGKTKDNFKNNLYVKNFPKNFTEEDLKKIFEGFGEIKSVVISRDTNGESKGFGFVCLNNPGEANTAFRELREKSIIFEGLEPLYINYAQRKEERVQMLMKDSFKLENLTIFARLRDDMYLIKSTEQFETEIKNLLKLLLNQDYSPREIKIRMDSKTALITMNSKKDLDLLMTKYVDYSSYYLPRIFLNYYQSKNDRSLTNQYVNQLNTLSKPVNMFSNFKNLSIVDPNYTPIINIQAGQLDSTGKKTKNNNYTNDKYRKNHYYSKNNYYGVYYNQTDYNNNYAYPKNYKYPKNNTKNQEDLVELDDKKSDKQSVETPLYESENKDEAASQIYEIVEKRYPE